MFESFLNALGSLLTSKRVHLCASLLAMTSWFLIILLNIRIVEIGERPGVDFIMIYTGAKLAATSPENLYNVTAQELIQRDLIPPALKTTAEWRYNYPPFFSIALMPFGELPYVQAYWAWTAASIVLYLVSIWLLLRVTPSAKAQSGLIFLTGIASPALLWCVITGQTTALGLFLWTLAFYLIKQKRPFCSGLMLGLLAYRFHFLVVLAPVLLFKRLWRPILGLGLSCLTLVAAGALTFSVQSYFDYVANLRVLSERILEALHPLPKYVSAYGFFRLFLPNSLALAFTMAVAALLVYWLAQMWRGTLDPTAPAFDLKFSLAVVATLLLMHHSLLYDLMLLTIPAILVYSNKSLFPPYCKLLLALLYFAPYYSFIIAEKSGFNPSSPLLLWLSYEIYRGYKTLAYRSLQSKNAHPDSAA